MLQLAHGALHGTRGAAAAVRLPATASGTQLHFAASATSRVSLHGGDSARHLVSHNGIVGSNMRKVQEFTMPLTADAMLIMHTDGIATHWDLERYPGLSQRHPALIAAVLYRDHVARARRRQHRGRAAPAWRPGDDACASSA